MTVGSNLITQTIRTSFVIAGALFVVLAPYTSFASLWGFSIGILLSVLNLWTLNHIFSTFFAPDSSKNKLFFYLGIKFPLFYILIISVLYWLPVSLSALTIGFLLPFGVMVLKELGQTLIKKQTLFSPTQMERQIVRRSS